MDLTENDSLEGQGTLAGPGPSGDKKEDSGQDGAARPDADDQEPRSGSSTGNIKVTTRNKYGAGGICGGEGLCKTRAPNKVRKLSFNRL